MSEFQLLYENYNREIYHFILKLADHNSSLAEELTQEAFYQVYLSMSNFRGDSDVRTWIYAVAKNVCYKYFRKNPTGLTIAYSEETEHTEHMQGQADSSKTPYEMLELKDDTARIRKEILQLKKKYRDVLLCRLFLEMSFREVSKTMRISENSAKVIYHRGLKMLKERLEGSDDEG